MRRRRSGFALMAALWLVVLVGVTGYELSVQARVRRLAVANTLETEQGAAAAAAGLESGRARLEIAGVTEVFGRQDTVALGDERFSTVMWDAGSRLQVNRATEDDVRRLLIALEVDAGTADMLAQRITDWRDADDLRRARGAERDDYVVAGARTLPANGPLAEVSELRDVNGMTEEAYRRLAPHVQVHGTGQLNLNAAPRPVLLSLAGMSAEAADLIIRRRMANRPFRSIEELSAALSPSAREAMVEATAELSPRVVFETTEVVIESTGWVDGSAVRVRGRSMHERSGDSWLTSSRRVER